MKMYKGDTVPGLLVVGFGVLFLIPGTQLGIASTTSDNVPGAGFFPVIIATAVILFGLALFVKGIRDNGKQVYFQMDEEQKANIRPFFLTILGIAAFFLIWKFVRFEIAALAFSLFINWVYHRNWKFNVAFTVIFVGLIYCVFSLGLKIEFAI